MKHDTEIDEEIRLDKWLWAARFFKTRSLAGEAISGGKVEINGDRPKPSRVMRAGDKLTIRRGPYEWTIVVTDVSHTPMGSPIRLMGAPTFSFFVVRLS